MDALKDYLNISKRLKDSIADNVELRISYLRLMILYNNGVDVNKLETNTSEDFKKTMITECTLLQKNEILKYEHQLREFSFINETKKKELFDFEKQSIDTYLKNNRYNNALFSEFKIDEDTKKKFEYSYNFFTSNIKNNKDIENFLISASSMNNFSFENRLLVYSQMPLTNIFNPTDVKSIKKWKEEGFNILPGSKPLEILTLKNYGTKKIIRPFKVFDISQTTAKDQLNDKELVESEQMYENLKKELSIFEPNLNFSKINSLNAKENIAGLIDILSSKYFIEKSNNKTAFEMMFKSSLKFEVNESLDYDLSSKDLLAIELKKVVETHKNILQKIDVKSIIYKKKGIQSDNERTKTVIKEVRPGEYEDNDIRPSETIQERNVQQSIERKGTDRLYTKQRGTSSQSDDRIRSNDGNERGRSLGDSIKGLRLRLDEQIDDKNLITYLKISFSNNIEPDILLKDVGKLLDVEASEINEKLAKSKNITKDELKKLPNYDLLFLNSYTSNIEAELIVHDDFSSSEVEQFIKAMSNYKDERNIARIEETKTLANSLYGISETTKNVDQQEVKSFNYNKAVALNNLTREHISLTNPYHLIKESKDTLKAEFAFNKANLSNQEINALTYFKFNINDKDNNQVSVNFSISDYEDTYAWRYFATDSEGKKTNGDTVDFVKNYITDFKKLKDNLEQVSLMLNTTDYAKEYKDISTQNELDIVLDNSKKSLESDKTINKNKKTEYDKKVELRKKLKELETQIENHNDIGAVLDYLKLEVDSNGFVESPTGENTNSVKIYFKTNTWAAYNSDNLNAGVKGNSGHTRQLIAMYNHNKMSYDEQTVALASALGISHDITEVEVPDYVLDVSEEAIKAREERRAKRTKQELFKENNPDRILYISKNLTEEHDEFLKNRSLNFKPDYIYEVIYEGYRLGDDGKKKTYTGTGVGTLADGKFKDIATLNINAVDKYVPLTTQEKNRFWQVGKKISLTNKYWKVPEDLQTELCCDMHNIKSYDKENKTRTIGKNKNITTYNFKPETKIAVISESKMDDIAFARFFDKFIKNKNVGVLISNGAGQKEQTIDFLKEQKNLEEVILLNQNDIANISFIFGLKDVLKDKTIKALRYGSEEFKDDFNDIIENIDKVVDDITVKTQSVLNRFDSFPTIDNSLNFMIDKLQLSVPKDLESAKKEKLFNSIKEIKKEIVSTPHVETKNIYDPVKLYNEFLNNRKNEYINFLENKYGENLTSEIITEISDKYGDNFYKTNDFEINKKDMENKYSSMLDKQKEDKQSKVEEKKDTGKKFIGQEEEDENAFKISKVKFGDNEYVLYDDGSVAVIDKKGKIDPYSTNKNIDDEIRSLGNYKGDIPNYSNITLLPIGITKANYQVLKNEYDAQISNLKNVYDIFERQAIEDTRIALENFINEVDTKTKENLKNKLKEDDYGFTNKQTNNDDDDSKRNDSSKQNDNEPRRDSKQSNSNLQQSNNNGNDSANSIDNNTAENKNNDLKFQLDKRYSTSGILEEIPSKVISKNIQKDVSNYAKLLAKALGNWEFDKDKNNKLLTFAGVSNNIAPTGGNATFILWKPNSDYGVYLSLKYNGYGEPDYFLADEFIYRATNKQDKYKGFENIHTSKNTLIDDTFVNKITTLVNKVEQRELTKKDSNEIVESNSLENTKTLTPLEKADPQLIKSADYIKEKTGLDYSITHYQSAEFNINGIEFSIDERGHASRYFLAEGRYKNWSISERWLSSTKSRKATIESILREVKEEKDKFINDSSLSYTDTIVDSIVEEHKGKEISDEYKNIFENNEIVDFKHTKTFENLKVLKVNDRFDNEEFKKFIKYLSINKIGYYSRPTGGFVITNEDIVKRYSKDASNNEYSLFYTNAGGYTQVSNRNKEINGDYERVASFEPDSIKYYIDDLSDEVKDEIENHYNKEKAKKAYEQKKNLMLSRLYEIKKELGTITLPSEEQQKYEEVSDSTFSVFNVKDTGKPLKEYIREIKLSMDYISYVDNDGKFYMDKNDYSTYDIIVDAFKNGENLSNYNNINLSRKQIFSMYANSLIKKEDNQILKYFENRISSRNYDRYDYLIDDTTLYLKDTYNDLNTSYYTSAFNNIEVPKDLKTNSYIFDLTSNYHLEVLDLKLGIKDLVLSTINKSIDLSHAINIKLEDISENYIKTMGLWLSDNMDTIDLVRVNLNNTDYIIDCTDKSIKVYKEDNPHELLPYHTKEDVWKKFIKPEQDELLIEKNQAVVFDTLYSINLVWSEPSDTSNKKFNNLNDLQKFIKNEYENKEYNVPDVGYDKLDLDIVLKTHDLNNDIKLAFGNIMGRIDVSKSLGDFNPFKEHIADYISSDYDKKEIKVNAEGDNYIIDVDFHSNCVDKVQEEIRSPFKFTIDDKELKVFNLKEFYTVDEIDKTFIKKAVTWEIFTDNYLFDLDNETHLDLLKNELKLDLPMFSKDEYVTSDSKIELRFNPKIEKIFARLRSKREKENILKVNEYSLKNEASKVVDLKTKLSDELVSYENSFYDYLDKIVKWYDEENMERLDSILVNGLNFEPHKRALEVIRDIKFVKTKKGNREVLNEKFPEKYSLYLKEKELQKEKDLESKKFDDLIFKLENTYVKTWNGRQSRKEHFDEFFKEGYTKLSTIEHLDITKNIVVNEAKDRYIYITNEEVAYFEHLINENRSNQDIKPIDSNNENDFKDIEYENVKYRIFDDSSIAILNDDRRIISDFVKKDLSDEIHKFNKSVNKINFSSFSDLAIGINKANYDLRVSSLLDLKEKLDNKEYPINENTISSFKDKLNSLNKYEKENNIKNERAFDEESYIIELETTSKKSINADEHKSGSKEDRRDSTNSTSNLQSTTSSENNKQRSSIANGRADNNRDSETRANNELGDFSGWTKTDVLEALVKKDLDDTIVEKLQDKYNSLNRADCEKEIERLNKLLEKSSYEVEIFETSENYNEELDREDSDEYWNLAMFEGNIVSKESGETVEDTVTGRYVELDAVIEELEVLVKEYKNKIDIHKDEDFKIEEKVIEGGAKTRFKNNVTALEVIRKVEQNKPITKEEKVSLSKYTGWGGISQAFYKGDNSVAKGWEKEASELKDIMTDKEYSQARRSVLDSFYTDENISKAIWKAIDNFGFKGGIVLEPSIGVGNFIGYMPTHLKTNTQIIGVELDTTTAKIAKTLYRSAKIYNLGFEKYKLKNNSVSLAVGNPPFGSHKIIDEDNERINNMSIHNYFLCKTIDKLEEGGVMAMVVTNGFLDSKDETARAYIGEKANLIGAIRLPNNAFSKGAGTEVTTDLVFFQKRNAYLKSNLSEWLNIGELNDTPINSYFVNKSENLLGVWGKYGTMYQGGTPALIVEDGQNTKELLDDAISRLPRYINFIYDEFKYSNYSNEQGKNTIMKYKKNELADTLKLMTGNKTTSDARVNSFFINDDKLFIRFPDHNTDLVLKEVTTRLNSKNEEVPLTDKELERIKGMVKISDSANLIRAMQIDPSCDENILEDERKNLNDLYDKFVKSYSCLNSQTNKRLFSIDVNAPFVLALEKDYEKAITAQRAKIEGLITRKESAEKADIFFKRTQYPHNAPKKAESAKDALMISLTENANIDLNYMSSLLDNRSIDDISEELSSLGLIYEDDSKGWITKEEYLSGNVKQKLKETNNPRNIEALKTVIPKDVEAVDITVKPGASWIPPKHIEEFVTYITGDEVPRATYISYAGAWSITANAKDFNNDEYGTNRRTATSILKSLLNNKQIVVHDSIMVDGKEKLVVNEEATLSANNKLLKMRTKWDNWIWEDDTRRENLTNIYNNKFNVYVSREFDGSHLTFPGKVDDSIIKFRPTQANAIWRYLVTGVMLCDHDVGAGKTFTNIACMMEAKRVGKLDKPLVAVPNHIIGDWAVAWMTLYPNAKILVPDEKDFTKARRKLLMSRIATGDYDGIIIGHSQLKFIENDKEFEAHFIEEQIKQVQEGIDTLRLDDGEDARSVRVMENSRDALSHKLELLLKSPTDDNLTFLELGIDGLTIDESDVFKNLQYSTSLTKVGGLGNPTGSQMAFDLFIKVRSLLEKTGDKNVSFLTGTPISNTIAEMYTIQRYLSYNELKNNNLLHFDSWVKQYAEVVTDWEISPSGKYKMATRLSKFVNMPELIASYSQFTDVVTKEDIKKRMLEVGGKFPLPKLKNGKPTNIITERSEDQASFIGIEDEEGNCPSGTLIYRSENLPKGKPKKGGDNMLVIISDAKKTSIDMRLIKPYYKDHENSRVNVVVKQAVEKYKEWELFKGTQIIFCDISTPKSTIAKEKAKLEDLFAKADAGDEKAQEQIDEISPAEINSIMKPKFNLYEEMKNKLIEAGIPEKEIAFIHDANTDKKKQELYNKMRKGEVRFMLASTSKAGAGTNVQNRIVANHHVDVPWRPRDLVQRDGRVERQGNNIYELFEYVHENSFDYEQLKNDNKFMLLLNSFNFDIESLKEYFDSLPSDNKEFYIESFRYATRNTMDARMWQTLETKALFIEQVRQGVYTGRELDDIQTESMNSAEMKAIASGNPLFLKQLELKQEIKQLEAVKKDYDRTLFRNQDKLREAVSYIQSYDKTMNDYTKDIEKANEILSREEFSIIIDGTKFNKRADAGDKLLEIAKNLPITGELVVGKYGDFDILMAKSEKLSLLSKPIDFSIDAGNGVYTVELDLNEQTNLGIGSRPHKMVREIEKEKESYKLLAEEKKELIPQLEAKCIEFPDTNKLELLIQEEAKVSEALKPKKKEEKTNSNENTWVDLNKNISAYEIITKQDIISSVILKVSLEKNGKNILVDSSSLNEKEFENLKKIFNTFGGKWDKEEKSINFSKDGINRIDELIKSTKEKGENILQDLLETQNITKKEENEAIDENINLNRNRI